MKRWRQCPKMETAEASGQGESARPTIRVRNPSKTAIAENVQVKAENGPDLLELIPEGGKHRRINAGDVLLFELLSVTKTPSDMEIELAMAKDNKYPHFPSDEQAQQFKVSVSAKNRKDRSVTFEFIALKTGRVSFVKK